MFRRDHIIAQSSTRRVTFCVWRRKIPDHSLSREVRLRLSPPARGARQWWKRLVQRELPLSVPAFWRTRWRCTFMRSSCRISSYVVIFGQHCQFVIRTFANFQSSGRKLLKIVVDRVISLPETPLSLSRHRGLIIGDLVPHTSKLIFGSHMQRLKNEVPTDGCLDRL